MRKMIFGTLIAMIVVGAALLVERSIRLNRPITRLDSGAEQALKSDTKLKSFSTKEVVTFGKLKGKIFLVNFWASWCVACLAEMPSIAKLYDRLRGSGLEVISVNMDERPEKAIPAIVEKLHLNFQVYTDVDENLARQFNVVAIPFSAVIDRTLRVIWAESGERDWASGKVVNEIKELLKET
ncbi:MAG: TlpA family protein disulfide reductase [Deltaproteobacteria bacterium]|nr:TlpA family protein disulfide reductase [Deltaproteobacteria bacterium]